MVDSLRSAAPPTIVGTKSLNVVIACWPADRVASLSFPGGRAQFMFDSASRTPGSGRPLHAASHSRASSGLPSRQAAKRSFHSPCVLGCEPNAS